MKTCKEIYEKLYNSCYKTCNILDEDKRRRYANKYAVKNTIKKWKEQYALDK